MRTPPAPAEHAQLTSAMASIQQSFTSEASAILAEAVSDATRRHHPHVTPLHVAAALLSAPSSLLRNMCTMQQHQQQHQHRPMHPFLSCRALDLCFSIALDRIASIPSHSEGPIFSNALVASLKRAQAIQRRGSPDHPLLTIRVDLPHLTISILDDPSVSRVMSEAGFSSPRVKSSILQHISPKHVQRREIGLAVSGYRQEVKRVADVLMRQQKRNPVLVGDSGADFVMEEVLGMMRRGEFGDLKVISVGDSLSRAKTNELPDKIRGIVNTVSFKLVHNKGVVLDLGDLKWLVEAQNVAGWPKHSTEESRKMLIANARSAIAEVANILRHERRMWLVGTATCATYLKCQVYHPSMEMDWDLQALPIIPRSLAGVIPSFGEKGILKSTVESLNTSNSLAYHVNNGFIPLSWPSEKSTPASRGSSGLCRSCMKQHGDESSCVAESHQWEQYSSQKRLDGLMRGQLVSQAEETLNGTITEVTEKWQGSSQRLQEQLQLMPTSPGSNSSSGQHHLSASEPIVQTDLSLGLAPFSSSKHKLGPSGDAKSHVKLSEELSMEVNWQPEAAQSIASAVQGVKSGSHKRHKFSKSAIWLLFKGPDHIGKRKMAHALSMLLFSERPAFFNFWPNTESTTHEQSIQDRGKTILDLLVEAVKINPSRVIVLDGVDQADAVVRTAIKKAIMTGRIVDSCNREVGSLENTIFVLIIDSKQTEENIKPLGWHLELSVSPNTRKRGAEHEQQEERRNKSRITSQPLSLDLNLCTMSSSSTYNDDNDGEGIRDDGDDSDLTEESSQNISQFLKPLPVPPSISDIYQLLDDQAIDFKPFDLGHFKLNLSKIMSQKFASVIGATVEFEVELQVLDYMTDVILHGEGCIQSLEQWADTVFVPVVEHLKSKACLKYSDKVHLSVVEDQQPSCMMTSCHGTQLPVSVILAAGAT